MKLSKVERLLLANQYHIMSMLEKESADYHDRLREALVNGYESVYEDIFLPILDGLSVEECRFVQLAMALYGVMQRSHEELPDKAGIEAYARYVVEKERRFPYLKLGWGGFNSHVPMIDRYRQQVEVWRSMDEKPELTAEDITTILEVRGGTAR